MRRAALALLVALGHAHAAIYTHVDPVSGMTVLNNMPPAGRAEAVAPAPAASFPRIGGARQHDMDGARRTILETELDGERQALAKAADRDAAARHAANIAALKRELAGVR